MEKIRNAYRNAGIAAGAAMVGTLGTLAFAAPPPVYQMDGTEFDANRAGLTAILTLAVAVTVAFVGIRLLRKGGGQVR